MEANNLLHRQLWRVWLLGMLGILSVFPAFAAIPVVPHAAKNPAEVPPPIHRFNPSTVTVDLVAQEVVAEIAPGKQAWMWTFNGTVPGPMIRVMEGDTVVINVTNHLDNVEPHNIDLHAAMGPGGGAAVTDVMPGETKTLRFKALRSGAYIYHCAGEGMAWEHVSYGMYGLIQVEPRGGLPRVDKEFYVGQSDWYLRVDEALNAAEGLPSGTYSLDEERALDELPTLYTFNGHQRALADPAIFGEAIKVDQGDKVRFFFVTGGPNKGSNWHIIGAIFDRVFTGYHSDAVRNEETLYVAPGSAAVFEVSAPVPGKYLLVDHALWRVPKGAAGFMHVEAKVPPTVDQNGNVTNPGSWPLSIYAPVATGTGH